MENHSNILALPECGKLLMYTGNIHNWSIKMSKKKIAVIAILVILIALALLGYGKARGNNQWQDPEGTKVPAVALDNHGTTADSDKGEPSTCPKGSYSIGKDKDGVHEICKLEPTGCPYGDSIPLGPECDKFKPAEPKPPTATPNTEFVGQGK